MYINEVPTFSGINPQGIAALTLIESHAAAAINCRSLQFESSELYPTSVLHFLQPTSADTLVINSEPNPNGKVYTITLNLTIPGAHQPFLDWLDQHGHKKFVAYIVLKSGQVYLLGSKDLPFSSKQNFTSTFTHQQTIQLTALALANPHPVMIQALPHHINILT